MAEDIKIFIQKSQANPRKIKLFDRVPNINTSSKSTQEEMGDEDKGGKGRKE